MQYTTIGRSNLTVSKICLGTMHFGHNTDQNQSFAIMERALELGINFFDTANVYGGKGGKGKSEEIIGNWFKQGGGRRDKVVLATKVYGQMLKEYIPNEQVGISAYKIRKHAQASLKRLQTDHIDLYQVHHIDRHITPEEFFGTFERLTNCGDVLYMGTSNFPGWGLVKYQMHAERRGFLGIVSEQLQYNLLSRIPELEIVPAALEMGIGLLPYMPLAGGLLTGYKKVIQGSRTASCEAEYNMKIEGNAQLKDFSKLCKELGQRECVVAVAWALANPAVSSAIIGIRCIEHLDSIVDAAELVLDPDTMKMLNNIFNINKGRPLNSGPVPEAIAW